MLDVYITVDTEIWCDGWNNLDEKFPDAYRRYVYGPTSRGDWALPATLNILNEHGLLGNFFVEPLFSKRFGIEPLAEMVGLINEAKQETQLHLHTEWVDEAISPIFSETKKRQFIRQFSFDEQVQLFTLGKQLLKQAGVDYVSAFRAGGYGANNDTLLALAASKIPIDTSYNPASSVGVADMFPNTVQQQASLSGDTFVYPVTTFADGRGLRHLQVTACSFSEFKHVAYQALEKGWESLVLVSHNFELMNPSKTKADLLVTRRFEKMCKFLDQNRDLFRVKGFNETKPKAFTGEAEHLTSNIVRTGARMVEQASRSIWGS